MKKIDVINDAYSQMRISGLTVDPSGEDVEVALSRLESMMAEYEARNIGVNYTFEPEPDPNTLTNVGLQHKQMMATNLAVRLIPDFNKAVPNALMLQASQALSNSSSIVAAELVRQVRYPARQARGDGNTLRYNRWQRYFRQEVLAPQDSTTNEIFIGDINDYEESFDAYLKDAEDIQSFTIEADPRLTLVSSSQSGVLILYRVEALDAAELSNFQQVKIVVTTTTGRIETRLIDFQIISAQTVGEDQA